MHILLYVPDNRVTRNFLPQLWPFVLQQKTPPQHRVIIMDGNAVHYSTAELVRFIRENQVGLVGMGFMTRMAQKAYQMATAIREGTNALVVMGGPHITEVPDEPLGLTGRPRYADAVVLGEADDIWPLVVEDAVLGTLKPVYKPELLNGKDVKPSLKEYPVVPWDRMDLSLFDLMRFVPSKLKELLKLFGVGYEKAFVIPIESGRGCPYGCEFCTVTGFFGDAIRFRDNSSVIAELRRLKKMARDKKALVMVFFIDDNFAINRHRTKSLLRDMIRYDACLPWVAQISVNLLRDQELVKLMAVSGARWVFMGLESVDPASLKAAHKEFNRPDQYEAVISNLGKHGIYAITSFIYGMEGDTTGVGDRTLATMQSWPPGLPVFGLLTPYPATPLYERLRKEGRLTRPEHWLDFQAFKTAFTPKGISPDQAEDEVRLSWSRAYDPSSFLRAQRWMLSNNKTFEHQLTMFISRLLFRGIYFPQMSYWAWMKLLAKNYRTMGSLMCSGFRARRSQMRPRVIPALPPLAPSPDSLALQLEADGLGEPSGS